VVIIGSGAGGGTLGNELAKKAMSRSGHIAQNTLADRIIASTG
jgi:hypothetical protein